MTDELENQKTFVVLSRGCRDIAADFHRAMVATAPGENSS